MLIFTFAAVTVAVAAAVVTVAVAAASVVSAKLTGVVADVVDVFDNVATFDVALCCGC